MFNAERTIYNIKIQNRMKCNLNYVPLLNTTLNEKFNINPNEDTDTIKYPVLNLLTIGCGLINDIDNSNTRLNLKSSPHSPTDAALFKHVPFYLRPVSDFLTYPPSDKLRLHNIIIIDGIEYNVYYGYSITNFESKDDIIKYDNIETSYVNISKYDLSSSDVLNPTPNVNINLINKKYISDFVKIYTFFSLTEINDIINSFNILYPNEPKYITEIGVCTSKELNVNNKILNYMTQVSYFLDVKQDLEQAIINQKLDFYIEVGGMSIVTV